MKLIAIVFIFTAFLTFRALLTGFEGETSVSLPEFDTPNISFIDLSGGCSGFVDCTEYLGAVFYNVFAGIIFFILFAINVAIYMGELTIELVAVMAEAFPGAPAWINGIVFSVFILGLAMILYKLVRKGSSNA